MVYLDVVHYLGRDIGLSDRLIGQCRQNRQFHFLSCLKDSRLVYFSFTLNYRSLIRNKYQPIHWILLFGKKKY